ncbi:hypothetical protein IFM61606_03908 [Aspergillus udagawae]|uniref:NADH dehydrogenase [ubiquinone] 1 alpha subcomplex subunit n=1 Tax=Aspergillus udagawae TaxID=91492 RepID=A0A8H3NE20_9EURO|nr:uncharacterized protein Aud_007043 [Aspergillus udagawae]GFF27719.1 hypothetical protein IFM51744_00356 [Aspergillus udagawae]GFF78178.1 hypothetical protein IFM53868_02277 [Aspergillus udagawae]GFG05418.1 hypothetical protein IFM5058_02414 [Aspergillus udagawae]GFG24012.1 hypothetical protein IFM61606_03908 [Aspergillus udagawae]GIC90607.1 hypothetical protein Aud_007043 [Aspergillus udagawae]
MSPVNSLWFKWKSLRLPWRRSFLVGTDLSGNTYWEFKDSLNAGRFRRIVKYNAKTHYADVQVTPQWHQWLRYVRADPPSLEEQQQDVLRQLQIKQLAHLADLRWASKPSYLDKPQTQHPEPATRTSDATLNPPMGAVGEGPKTHNAVSGADTTQAAGTTTPTPDVAPTTKEDPWAKARTSDTENWQPESWTPSASRR